jgi:hypothetical protein
MKTRSTIFATLLTPGNLTASENDANDPTGSRGLGSGGMLRDVPDSRLISSCGPRFFALREGLPTVIILQEFSAKTWIDGRRAPRTRMCPALTVSEPFLTGRTPLDRHPRGNRSTSTNMDESEGLKILCPCLLRLRGTHGPDLETLKFGRN